MLMDNIVWCFVTSWRTQYIKVSYGRQSCHISCLTWYRLSKHTKNLKKKKIKPDVHDRENATEKYFLGLSETITLKALYQHVVLRLKRSPG